MALLKQTVIKAQTLHYAFLTMVKSCERNERDIHGILEKWYTIAFSEKKLFDGFTDDRETINELIRDIQLKLLRMGYGEQGLLFKPNRFKQHFYKGEVPMAKNNVEKKTTVKKAVVKKTVAKKKAVLNVSRPKGATGRVCDLLMMRKYTDEQIVGIIQTEFTDRNEKQIKVYCQVQRAEINSGRKPTFNVTKDQKLERFVEIDGKVVPYSTAPRKSNTNKKKKESKKRGLLKKHTDIPETVNKKELKEV